MPLQDVGETKGSVHELEDVAQAHIERSAREERLLLAQSMTSTQFEQCENMLKRKLDIRLMAVITFIYILNFLDRNNIAAAGVAGIQHTLGLSSTQFSTAVGLLFVGYILVQVPSNIFLAQLRPSIYIPACIALWGTISACTGVVQNASGLYATRFLLGVVEAAFYPGAVFLIGSWYKRSEMGLRVAILYSGSQIGSAVSGLIAAGITSGLNGVRGLAAWRWIFIIEGSVTVFVAIISAFLLPDYPGNTRWLSENERAVAEYRLTEDAGEPDEVAKSWLGGFLMAFQDWRTYLFAAMYLCAIVTSSTQNFFPAVVNTLGFSTIQTLLLTVPPYAFGAVVMIANNLSSDHFRNSSFHVMFPFAMAMVGFVLAAGILDTWPRYFAMFLFVGGGHGANAVVLAWSQKTMLRPRMKRAAVAAFVNAFGNSAQIWTSYLYSTNSAPRYVLAMSLNAGFALAGIILAATMRMVLLRSNARLDAAQQETTPHDEETTLARAEKFRFIA